MKVTFLPLKSQLFESAERGNILKALNILILNENYLYARNESGQNLMHIAASNNNFEFIKIILEKYTTYEVGAEDNRGKNIANIAVEMGYLQLIELLVLKDQSLIWAVNSNLQTLLHSAAIGNQLEVAKYLILKGTALDSKDIHGKTPLHYSITNANNKDHKIFEYLKEQVKEVDPTILHAAVEAGNVKLIDYLIDKKDIYIDTQNSEGITPLCVAINNKNEALAKRLIEKYWANGTINQYEDNYIVSALHLAAKVGYLELIKLILNDYSEDIATILDNNGATILYAAIDSNNCTEMIKYLVELSPNIVNITNIEGMSPLHLAVSLINLEAVKSLIEAKIDINVTNAGGYTVLDYAVLRAHKARIEKIINNEMNANNIVKLLLSQDNIVKSFVSKQLPYILINYGDLSVIKAFINRGFDINNTDKNLFYSACKNGHIEIMKLLITYGINTRDEKSKKSCLSVSSPASILEAARIISLAQIADDLYNIKPIDVTYTWLKELNDEEQTLICDRIKNKLIRQGLPKGYETLEEYKNIFSNLLTEHLLEDYPCLQNNMQALSQFLESSHNLQLIQINAMVNLSKSNCVTNPDELENFLLTNNNGMIKISIEKFKKCISDLHNIVTDRKIYELVKKITSHLPELVNNVQFNVVKLNTTITKLFYNDEILAWNHIKDNSIKEVQITGNIDEE